MKPRSIAIALAFCTGSLVSTPLVSTSYAQMPTARQQRLMARGRQLHLTRKQAMQLYPILNAEEPKLQAIRNDPSLSRVEKFKRLQAVHAASNPQIKAILTPAQFQHLQAFRQQRRAEFMAEAKGNSSAPGRNPHQGEAARSK
jgi:Spy/CpxP family protein refolding chaperone